MKLDELDTEQRNEATMNIDEASALEIVTLINNEDKKVAKAVEKELPKIAQAVDVIADALKSGGRLVYCGAGTSGRLGVLDASECPPTYGVSPNLVVALMAGGDNALLNAVEGAEDSAELCERDLREIGFCKRDVLVAIAASGRTPYAIGGMKYANTLGATAISLTCTANSEMAEYAGIAISPIVGAEAVTGSTRMKAGTAQKLVLNMLSTGAMIRLGKVYQNLMVDVQPSNEKLILRCQKIVVEATGESYDAAKNALEQCGYHPKTAITMLLGGFTVEEARERLDKSGGRIKEAIG